MEITYNQNYSLTLGRHPGENSRNYMHNKQIFITEIYY